MPQLDKFTYFTQFFWSCLFLFLLSIFFHYFFPLGIQVRLFCFYLTRPKLQRALSIMKWFIFFCLLVSLVYRIYNFFDLIFMYAPYFPFRPVDPTRKLLTYRGGKIDYYKGLCQPTRRGTKQRHLLARTRHCPLPSHH